MHVRILTHSYLMLICDAANPTFQEKHSQVVTLTRVVDNAIPGTYIVNG